MNLTKWTYQLQIHLKTSTLILQNFTEQVVEELAECNCVEIRNFGVFEVVDQKAKVVRGPRASKVDAKTLCKNAVRVTPEKRLGAKAGRL